MNVASQPLLESEATRRASPASSCAKRDSVIFSASAAWRRLPRRSSRRARSRRVLCLKVEARRAHAGESSGRSLAAVPGPDPGSASNGPRHVRWRAELSDIARPTVARVQLCDSREHRRDLAVLKGVAVPTRTHHVERMATRCCMRPDRDCTGCMRRNRSACVRERRSPGPVSGGTMGACACRDTSS